MKTLKLFTTIVLLLLSFSLISAQDSTVEIDTETAENESIPIVEEKEKTTTSTNKYFELELIRGTQNPLTKSIPYTLYITPKIESEETQILWSVPSTLIAKPSHKEFQTLQKDQTYTFKMNVSPQREGSYEVTANIVSWQYDINYTNSVSSTLELSKNLVVQPVDSEYTLSILLLTLGGLILLGMGGFLAYKASDKLIKKLKSWLTPPF